MKDNNKERYYELSQEITEVENQEEQLEILRLQHEANMMEAYSDFRKTTSDIEELLLQSPEMTLEIMDELGKNQERNYRVRHYVEDYLAEVIQIVQKTQQAYACEKARLIKERDDLPWE